MTTSDNVVSVRDLRKTYGGVGKGAGKNAGGVVGLDGVTFDIRRGETFALLGPNGAGKSTTIEILEGYRDRTGGDASVLGVDPQRGGIDWKARLGIVLQNTGESGNVTVLEQITHFAGYYHNPRDIGEVIDAVGLTNKSKTRIGKLSGGQRRRVDVALGIIGRPELLFLDEPTTGFDPEARHQFWTLIDGLKADGTTILLTTHYLDEAEHLADRAAIINGGRIVDMGNVKELGGAEARVPLVRWREGDVMREERTDEPAALVARLSREVGATHGGSPGEPDMLEIIRPSLEDIYLGLVGADSATEGEEELDAEIDTKFDTKAARA